MGAVRFDSHGVVEDTLSTLVNPGRPIPYRIQMLTGIDSEEVAKAPSLEEVAPRLQEFIDGLPLVGQNIIGFDLRFLDAAGISHSPLVHDTRELAVVLLPLATERSLAALSQHFQIDTPRPHRALADAQATREVFLALRQRAACLPPAVLAEAERLAAASRWSGRTFFTEVAKEVGLSLDAVAAGPTASPPKPPKPLTPHRQRQPTDASEVLGLLRSLKERPDVLPSFEERPEQEAMAEAVTETLNDGGQLLVEAGTGIGKSLAYLLPAACFARLNNRRVIISTATINLQAQLTDKDIPTVQRLLEGFLPGKPPLAAAQLKGKRNYLCLRRYLTARRAPSFSSEEARFLLRLLLWLNETESGDRGDLRLSPKEEALWYRFSAQNENCLGSACPFALDGSCFLVRARKRADAAHLVVVNHALLLSDVATGGRLIPTYDDLVVDEAHHLEEEATRQLGFEAGDSDLSAYLDRLHRSQRRERGASLTAAVRQSARGLMAPLGPASRLTGAATTLADAVEGARERLRQFSEALRSFLEHHAEESGDYDQRLLLSRGVRAQPDWTTVEMAWENLQLTLSAIEEALVRLRTALSDGEGLDQAGDESLQAETDSLLQMGQELRQGIAAIIDREDPERIQWLEASGPGGIGMGSAPLEVGPLLDEHLYADCSSVVLTSATLTSQNSFAFIRERLGLEDARELLLGSPFDYRRAALVLLPQDVPEPSTRGYQEALHQTLVELCKASEGRTLALFTSHASLRAAHAALREPLALHGVTVLGQGIDGAPQQLLGALRRDSRTAILGTASFWEGVDVVGEALSLLVVTRLPFSVPSEPVFAARSALFEQPFMEYAVPQAILRFKQGFGRLIRTSADRGVVALLDRRVTSKRYGRLFLDSLPPCQLEDATLAELPLRVSQWLRSSQVSGG